MRWHKFFINIMIYIKLQNIICSSFLQMSTMVLFWFNLYSGYSGSTHIDSLLLLFIHVLYCAFPPIVNGIMDKDLSPKTLMENPEIYKIGPKGKVSSYMSVSNVPDRTVFQAKKKKKEE